jgi:hypothetical protein
MTARLFVAGIVLCVVSVVGAGAQTLYEGEAFTITDTSVVQDSFRSEAPSRTAIVLSRSVARPRTNGGRATWTVSEDLSGMPSYTSEHRLVDALYALSMEEVLQHQRDDGTYRVGGQQSVGQTQVLSYSTLLSLALIDPEGAKASLWQRVEDGRIQANSDASDRTAWALAAWEVFKTTGDTTWLRKSYDVIRRSANTALQTAFDERAGLFHGATAFLSERERAYPAWMGAADIYRSQALSTNVVHYRTYRILTQMAETLGKFPDQWARVARRVKQGLNEHLWDAETNRYVAYRYGRTYRSPVHRVDAFGQALVVLSGVTGSERARRVAQHQPVVDFGAPVFWPYASDDPGFNGIPIRPVVNAYWTWASAAAQNTPGVEHGLASLYRATALFRTTEDTMTAFTGHVEGMRNHAAQLGSAAGLLATVYRVFFGMRATTGGLKMAPFVPASYSGTHTLEGVPYRNATLNLTMKGHGTRIVQVTLDGEPLNNPVIPPDLTGTHDVRLLLSGGLPDGELNRVEPRTVPATPVARSTEEGFAWKTGRDDSTYRIFRNGVAADTTTDLRFPVSVGSVLAEYQIQAEDEAGGRSFRSEPIRVIADTAVQVVAPRGSLATTHEGYTGRGYRALAEGDTDSMSVTVPASGTYALDLRYANGHASASTDRANATRIVRVGEERVGTAVFPPGGDGWGYSNVLRRYLTAGSHTVVLAPNSRENGDGRTIFLDHLRLTPLSNESTADTP